MKAFVRDLAPTVIAVMVVTLLVTALAGGSETAFYLAFIAALAGALRWEIRKGRL